MIILIVVVLGATGVFGNLRQLGTGIDFDWLTGSGGAGTVAVNKQLDVALTDQYGGSALASKTLKVYDSNGATLLETLTTGSDGTDETAFTYESGKQIFIYYEDSNDKQWFDVVIPEMNKADAESATYNVIQLKSFTIGTYSTDSLKMANGTTFADASTYDVSNRTTTPTWTYGLANTGSDNTGLKSSYDPSYKMRFDVVLYMTFSGTGYESVLVYGDFDQDFTLGTTHYLAKTLDPYALTLHKEGWKYLSNGVLDTGFWMDLSGIDTGDSVTWQIYVYAYSDPAWCMNHGADYGYEKVELAEHTVTIVP